MTQRNRLSRLDRSAPPNHRVRPVRLTALAGLTVLATMAIALVGLTPVVLARSQQATITDSEYKPNDITINVNEVVTWVSDSDLEHTVTADDGLFDSGKMARGEAFANVFSRPGTYTYHCTVYGFTGKITVEGPGPTRAPTAAPTPTPPPGTLPPSLVPAETPVGSAPVASPEATAAPAPDAGQNVTFSPAVLIGAIAAVIVAVLLVLFVIPRPKGSDGPGESGDEGS
jgi:plastocyanin